MTQHFTMYCNYCLSVRSSVPVSASGPVYLDCSQCVQLVHDDTVMCKLDFVTSKGHCAEAKLKIVSFSLSTQTCDGHPTKKYQSFNCPLINVLYINIYFYCTYCSCIYFHKNHNL